MPCLSWFTEESTTFKFTALLVQNFLWYYKYRFIEAQDWNGEIYYTVLYPQKSGRISVNTQLVKKKMFMQCNSSGILSYKGKRFILTISINAGDISPWKWVHFIDDQDMQRSWKEMTKILTVISECCMKFIPFAFLLGNHSTSQGLLFFFFEGIVSTERRNIIA